MRDINKLKRDIVNIADNFLGSNYLLIIFGSFAKEKEDRGSDIDLAVYRDNRISAKIIVQLREELNEKVLTLRQIDLINLTDGNINAALIKNILEQGVVWKKAKNSEGLLRDLKKRLVNIGK